MTLSQVSNQEVVNASRKKIDALISIGAGEILENTLNKVVNYQLTKYKDNIVQINRELEKFENTYKMASQEFYRKFEAGELGDGADFFEWSSLYENIRLYEGRMKKLESLEA